MAKTYYIRRSSRGTRWRRPTNPAALVRRTFLIAMAAFIAAVFIYYISSEGEPLAAQESRSLVTSPVD